VLTLESYATPSARTSLPQRTSVMEHRGVTGGGHVDDQRFLLAEQAALRRVATLVARGAAPEVVFDAVCQEMGQLIGASITNLAHFAPNGTNVTAAGWSTKGNHLPTGTVIPLEGTNINVLVRDTRAPGRIDSYEGAGGPLAAALRSLGIRSEVGAPVLIEGAVWGALIAASDSEQPLPAGTELRVASFAELIAAAVANAAARAELVASRARIVTAADDARRRLARDLHDGAQQRLVSTIISLQLAERSLEQEPASTRRLMRDAFDHARAGLAELRELAAGVHPSILTNRGLQAAIEALAQRNITPVSVEVPDQRYPAHVEATAYFVVAEALTNATKHAQATQIAVSAHTDERALVVDIRDDGIGGADACGGGLQGLRDRVEALTGTLTVTSSPELGTHVHATLPLTIQDGGEPDR
jgi:signal transduction histidine kinase